jgi:hypothetical protein
MGLQQQWQERGQQACKRVLLMLDNRAYVDYQMKTGALRDA